MSSTLDAIVAALTAEFDLEVVFQATMPTALTAPSVVVVPSPDENYLEPATSGGVGTSLILERWNVLAVVNISEPKSGLDQMRDLSLRVRRAIMNTGAVWRSATGPRRLAADNSNVVFSENAIDFKYDPAQHLA